MRAYSSSYQFHHLGVTDRYTQMIRIRRMQIQGINSMQMRICGTTHCNQSCPTTMCDFTFWISPSLSLFAQSKDKSDPEFLSQTEIRIS